jgi:hypothetical protein
LKNTTLRKKEAQGSRAAVMPSRNEKMVGYKKLLEKCFKKRLRKYDRTK